MSQRILSALVLCAGTIFLTACSGGTVTSSSTSGPQLYAVCSACNGTAGVSGVYSYAINSSSATVTSSLTAPAASAWQGMQLDSIGNIYVTNEGSNSPYAQSVIEYAAGSTGAATPTRTVTSSTITNGDFDGDVIGASGTLYYFDDSDGFEVFSPTAGLNATSTLTNTAINSVGFKDGVTDSAGNLYLATFNDTLVVLPVGFTSSTAPVTINFGSTPRSVEAVSIDSSNNLYIMGKGNGSSTTGSYLIEIPQTLTSTAVTPTKVLTLSAVTNPFYSVALDSTGNIYAVASLNPMVIDEYSATAATGTAPSPINTITTTLNTSNSSFGVKLIAIH